MNAALTHRSTPAVRFAYAALFAGSLVAAISVAGPGTWQIWAFLIGPDIALLLGIAPGLETGQLHPRAVPAYNVLHRLGGPLLLGLASIWLGSAWLGGALAWAAHVFMDRAFGYGRWTPEGFVRGP